MRIERGPGIERHVASSGERIFTPRAIRAHALRRRPSYEKIVEAYERTSNTRGTLILCAHGIRQIDREDQYLLFPRPQRAWEYVHPDGSAATVQSWIDAHDGMATLLLIEACNPYDWAITSERSLVLHPRCSFNAPMVLSRNGLEWRMYVPGKGYLDTSHARKRALNSLTT